MNPQDEEFKSIMRCIRKIQSESDICECNYAFKYRTLNHLPYILIQLNKLNYDYTIQQNELLIKYKIHCFLFNFYSWHCDS